jgi:hypothetical protein
VAKKRKKNPVDNSVEGILIFFGVVDVDTMGKKEPNIHPWRSW